MPLSFSAHGLPGDPGLPSAPSGPGGSAAPGDPGSPGAGDPMARVPEPELMDDPDQVQAYAAADFSAGDQALVDRLAILFPAGLGEDLLDLGCGPGTISERLAQAYPDARVLGIDGATAMLAVAMQGLQERPHLAGRLRYQRLLLGGHPQRLGPFTGLVSNSLLHHLHDPQVLWTAVRHWAAPGARVYIKDLRRPDSPAQAEALRRQHLGAAPAVLQRDYLASLHAAFRPEEVEQQLRRCGLGALRVEPVEDRYLEVWGQLV